jgi:hypothetical protein
MGPFIAALLILGIYVGYYLWHRRTLKFGHGKLPRVSMLLDGQKHEYADGTQIRFNSRGEIVEFVCADDKPDTYFGGGCP